MSSTDALTLPPVSMADLDVVAALVAFVANVVEDEGGVAPLGQVRGERQGDAHPAHGPLVRPQEDGRPQRQLGLLHD